MKKVDFFVASFACQVELADPNIRILNDGLCVNFLAAHGPNVPFSRALFDSVAVAVVFVSGLMVGLRNCVCVGSTKHGLIPSCCMNGRSFPEFEGEMLLLAFFELRSAILSVLPLDDAGHDREPHGAGERGGKREALVCAASFKLIRLKF